MPQECYHFLTLCTIPQILKWANILPELIVFLEHKTKLPSVRQNIEYTDFLAMKFIITTNSCMKENILLV